MKKDVHSQNAPVAIGPYSQAIALDNLVFVSGQLPLAPNASDFASDDIAELTKQSLQNIREILCQAGSSMDKVVKTTIYLVDLMDFAIVNTVYAEFFEGEFPARSCVQVAALPKGAKLEIEAIAIR